MKWFAYILSSLLLVSSVLGMKITEVMYNPNGTDTGREWIEVQFEEVDWDNLQFFNREGNHGLRLIREGETASGYAIITNDASVFLEEYSYTGTLLEASYSLRNTGESIGLRYNGNVIENISYDANLGNGNGKSIERVNEHWKESENWGGTPGMGETAEVPEFTTLASLVILVICMIGFWWIRR